MKNLDFNGFDFGLNFLCGLKGTELLPEEITALKGLRPIGIIIFKHNISQTPNWQEKLKHLIDSAREIVGRENFLVAIDHEGGRVHRLPSPVTHFPSALEYRDRAFEVGATMGQELKELGFNLNFAPSVDIFSNPKNSVIGNRAFGSSKEEIFRPALEFLKGMKSQGVEGCIKHFPGHGATIQDSHFTLPELELTKEEFYSQDFAPFIELINSQDEIEIKFLMTAHILCKKLDKENPATLSKEIITNILRNEIGYQGIIFSDDFEMKALTHIPFLERVIRTLNAGVDIILEGNPHSGIALSHAYECALKLAVAIEKKELDEKLLSESHIRLNLAV